MKFNRINKLIEVLKLLDAAQVPQGTNMLAAQVDGSLADLQQSLCRLAKAGVINAKRGPNGGFVRNRPLTEITYLDLMRALRIRNLDDHTVVKLFSQPIA